MILYTSGIGTTKSNRISQRGITSVPGLITVCSFRFRARARPMFIPVRSDASCLRFRLIRMRRKTHQRMAYWNHIDVVANIRKPARSPLSTEDASSEESRKEGSTFILAARDPVLEDIDAW